MNEESKKSTSMNINYMDTKGFGDSLPFYQNYYEM